MASCSGRRGPRASLIQDRSLFSTDTVEVTPDPDDPERVRLVLVRALGPPPGRSPDQRKIELTCPRDMIFATALPHNIDLAPLPARS